MPKLTAVDVIKKMMAKVGIKQKAKSTDSALTKETLHYSRTGAETMPRRISESHYNAGGQVLQNAEVRQLLTENNQVKSIIYSQDGNTHELDCDACISTIPIKTLAQMMQPVCPVPIFRQPIGYVINRSLFLDYL